MHNWNKHYLPKGTDTNQSKQQNQPLYPMTLLKRKQPDNVSCTISVFIMVQIEEFSAWEEVFWLAWMFWIFPCDTASIHMFCWPCSSEMFLRMERDNLNKNWLKRKKCFLWLRFATYAMLKFPIESIKEEGRAKQNSFFYNDEENNKNEKWLFLSPKRNIEVKMSLSTSF